MLPVSAPFHSLLMQPAAEKLAIELDKVEIRDAKIPVVANVNGKVMHDAATIKNLLVKQAASPVKWEDCVAEIVEQGAKTFIEVGPGKVLNGFNKKIDKLIINLNVEEYYLLRKNS